MSSLIQASLTQAYIVTALSHVPDNFSIQKWRQSIKDNVGLFLPTLPVPPPTKKGQQHIGEM